MTRRLTLTPRAEHDLDEIWRYTRTEFGAAQAAAYLRRLGVAMEGLCGTPFSAPEVSEVGGGVRKKSIGAHRLFYKVDDAAVIVLRVLHARMDIDDLG